MKEIHSTYLNPMDSLDKLLKVYNEIKADWVNAYEKSFMTVLTLISEGKQKEAQDAFLKGLDEFTRVFDAGQDKLGMMLADTIVDAYQVGFSEGEYDSEQDLVKNVTKFIDEGSLSSIDDLIRLLTVIKVTSDKNFSDHMKGRSLMVDKRDLFGYNKGNDK